MKLQEVMKHQGWCKTSAVSDMQEVLGLPPSVDIQYKYSTNTPVVLQYKYISTI